MRTPGMPGYPGRQVRGLSVRVAGIFAVLFILTCLVIQNNRLNMIEARVQYLEYILKHQDPDGLGEADYEAPCLKNARSCAMDRANCLDGSCDAIRHKFFHEQVKD